MGSDGERWVGGRYGAARGDWVGELVRCERTETFLHVPPLGGSHRLAWRRRRLARRWAAAATAAAAEGVAATASHATASHATAHATGRRSWRRPRRVGVRPGHLLGTVLHLGLVERLAVADAGAILQRVAVLEGVGMHKHIIAAPVRNDEPCATVIAGAWSDGQVAGRERRGAIGWVSWWGVSAPKPFSMFHRLAVPIDLPGGGGGSPGGGPPPPPPPPKPPPPPPLKSDDSPAPPLLKPDGAADAPAPDMNFCESCCASAIAAARASKGTAAENPAASAGGPSEKPEPAAGASEKRLRRLGGSSTALSRSRDRERSRSRLLRSSSRRDSPRSDMAESCARQRRPPRRLASSMTTKKVRNQPIGRRKFGR